MGLANRHRLTSLLILFWWSLAIVRPTASLGAFGPLRMKTKALEYLIVTDLQSREVSTCSAPYTDIPGLRVGTPVAAVYST